MKEVPPPRSRLPIAIDEVLSTAPHTTPPAKPLPVPIEYREQRRTQPGVSRAVQLVPAPSSDDERDSMERPMGALLKELSSQAEQTRAAKAAEVAARAHAAELAAQLEAAKRVAVAPLAAGSIRPRGPTVSLGDAKWWVLVIGALAAGSAGLSALVVKWHELDRPTATQAQVTEVKTDVKDTTELAKKHAAELKKTTLDSDQRARISAAFLCAQGLRANGLDCEALLKQVQFQPQPLNPRRVIPLWHTSSEWPAIPDAD